MRKTFYKITASILSIFLFLFSSCNTQITNSDTTNLSTTTQKIISEENLLMRNNTEEYYIFNLSDDIERTQVSYQNRYGITMAADVYMAKELEENQTYPAIVIGPPYGGVKEQGAGLYANELAKRGFVVLAFDQPYMGASDGEPRRVSSPDLFSESFSVSVDFLGSLPQVDRERIGAIGICGSGGFAITAAQVDKRIKAVATSVMYNMSDSMRNSKTPEELDAFLNQISQQRWVDAENGTPEYIPAFPTKPSDSIPEGLDPVSAEFHSYYGMQRGHHPNALGGFTTTSQLSFINFPLDHYIQEISPRPILFIAGENAHSLHFSEDAYEAALEPKELYIVPDANHVDLYDGGDHNYIPFDKLEEFFKNSL